mmetsp:Transcript_18532/g.56929  ORF Transcript_18532/g.56929 Transcript_18532/m.56929 type:complete len:452 (+) Transcript_18532:1071-2426(+)
MAPRPRHALRTSPTKKESPPSPRLSRRKKARKLYGTEEPLAESLSLSHSGAKKKKKPRNGTEEPLDERSLSLSARTKKPRNLYGTEEPLAESLSLSAKKKKKPGRKKKARESESQWLTFEKRADGLIAKALAAQFYVDSYEGAFSERSPSGGSKKVRPDREIAAARRRVAAAKTGLRDLLKEIDALNADVRWSTHDDEVDVEEVGCSFCGGFTSDETNDIVLCDRKGCFRAFHVDCCDPPLTPEQLGDLDDDWFCHQCNCSQRIVDKINEKLDRSYHDPDRWTTLFESDDDEEDDVGPPAALQHGANTILGTDLPSDDDDDDFDDNEMDDDLDTYGDVDREVPAPRVPRPNEEEDDGVDKVASSDEEERRAAEALSSKQRRHERPVASAVPKPAAGVVKMEVDDDDVIEDEPPEPAAPPPRKANPKHQQTTDAPPTKPLDFGDSDSDDDEL